MNSRSPAVPPRTATEFCLLVNSKEKYLDYGMLGEGNRLRDTLVGIVDEYTASGDSAQLERRSHAFLLDYQVLDNGVLDESARAELDQILEQPMQGPSAHQALRMQRVTPWSFVNWRRVAVIATAICVVIIATYVAITLAMRSGSTPPPAQPGTSGQHQVNPNVPPGDTSLQQLVQKYGLTHQITPSAQFPQTGAPGLLLLESGNYLVSKNWTIPANQPNWQPDLSQRVSGVDMQGKHAVIQDQNGNQYVVKIDQPFIFADDPIVVIRIDSTGHAFVLKLAFAKSVRY